MSNACGNLTSAPVHSKLAYLLVTPPIPEKLCMLRAYKCFQIRSEILETSYRKVFDSKAFFRGSILTLRLQVHVIMLARWASSPDSTLSSFRSTTHFPAPTGVLRFNLPGCLSLSRPIAETLPIASTSATATAHARNIPITNETLSGTTACRP